MEKKEQWEEGKGNKWEIRWFVNMELTELTVVIFLFVCFTVEKWGNPDRLNSKVNVEFVKKQWCIQCVGVKKKQILDLIMLLLLFLFENKEAFLHARQSEVLYGSPWK